MSTQQTALPAHNGTQPPHLDSPQTSPDSPSLSPGPLPPSDPSSTAHSCPHITNLTDLMEKLVNSDLETPTRDEATSALLRDTKQLAKDAAATVLGAVQVVAAHLKDKLQGENAENAENGEIHENHLKSSDYPALKAARDTFHAELDAYDARADAALQKLHAHADKLANSAHLKAKNAKISAKSAVDRVKRGASTAKGDATATKHDVSAGFSRKIEDFAAKTGETVEKMEQKTREKLGDFKESRDGLIGAVNEKMVGLAEKVFPEEGGEGEGRSHEMDAKSNDLGVRREKLREEKRQMVKDATTLEVE